MPKVLIIAPHRINRAPSQRFRFEQYIELLELNGFSFEFSNLLSEKDDEIFYRKGYLIRKALIIIKAFFLRIIDLRRCKSFDLVLIQREAFFIGSAFFEKFIAKNKIDKII